MVMAALLSITFWQCGSQDTDNKEKTTEKDSLATNSVATEMNASNAKLQVMYFHATNRCETCNAVEDNALKLLRQQYKKQMDKGDITFASYNVDDEANIVLVEKYEISFSTLLLVKADGTKTDLTDVAFQYAHTEPLKYADLLKVEIDKNLN